ncbi:hypothetical protein CL617_02695 [archaeon]|nr:hypothetical protein [archaeon]|tara:strand:- start:3917 stop:4393 length:477 start_codon:yes stop_codon:yes gene_type:complete
MEKDKFKLKEEYSQLKAKLPNFEKLNDEFEISRNESDYKKEFLLRDIRRKMNDKIIFFCRIIEGLLFPVQANIINMHESKYFDDDIKKKILESYRQLMIFERESLRLDIIPNSEKDAKYINNVYNELLKYKKEMKNVVDIMQESWRKEEKIVPDNYFG